MGAEVFRLGATTPANAVAHAGAYLQASAQAGWSSRRGIDLTAGYDLQGKVNAAAGGSGVAASFSAGVDISGALKVQAALPVDLFSADGAGLIARLQAKLALTAFVTAAISLDRGVLEQTVRADFGGPMSSLLDIVLDELDISAGFWGRASLAIQALGEAVLAGTLLPSADGGAGLTFSARYETAYVYGAGTHFITNLGFAHPQRLFTRLTGTISDELLALVTPADPDEASAVAVGLGALHTLLPVAIRGLFQLGMALGDSSSPASPAATGTPAADPSADTSTAISTLASSLIAQGQQAVLQAVSDLAMSLLGDALTDARLVSALSRLTASDLTTVTGQLTTLQADFQALTGTDISDIDQWLTGLLSCLGGVDDVLTSLTGFGVPADVTGGVQSWTALLWAAGTLLQRIISWADDASTGSPFGSDPVTPTPAASVAAAVKPAGGPIAYSDVAAYLIGSQIVTSDLETALRNAIPQADPVFDWLSTVLGSGQGKLLPALFQDLAAPSAQQAAALITQLTAAASDALANHILPELLDPLAAAETDPAVAAFLEDVVKPCLTALPQVILPGLAGLGTDDATLRMREAISALLLQVAEHFLASTLKALIDHALTNAQATLNAAAADLSPNGPVVKAVRDIDVLALVDSLMQFALGSDATRPASMQALTGTDQPVDQTGLTQALRKVGDGAVKTAEDILADLPSLIANHVANEPAAIVAAIEQVAGQVVAALNSALNSMAAWVNNLSKIIKGLEDQIATAIGGLGQAIAAFGQHVQTLIAQAVEAVRKEGLRLIEDLMGGPPVSWVQHAIVDLYNDLFAAIADLADFLGGILGVAAEALGEALTAIAGGAHGTQSTADDTVRQGLVAASHADLSFDLKVSVFGVTLLDLGTVTISAGSVGGLLHDLLNADTSGDPATYQSTLSKGMQTATSAAGLTAQKAAAQTQQAVGTSDLSGLKATVADFTLPAAPQVMIVTPAPGASVPSGARVLISVTGANRGFVESTLGAAPRIVITVNGTRWTYQASDWVAPDDIHPRVLNLQADLVALPVSGGPAAAPAAPLAPQSVATAPTVTATFDGRTGTLLLRPTAPPPPGTQPEPPQPLDITGQPWTRRALLHQALAEPSGTVTGGLAGAGRFTATSPGPGQRAPVPVPAPWTLNPPAPDPATSRSVPIMMGKFGLNTISVAVADGAGHTATATTTVVIEPGPLYAISAKPTGFCLTAAGGESAASAGVIVQQQAWVGGRNQMWQPVTGMPAPPDGAVDLVAGHSGLALGLSAAVPVGDYAGWYECANCGGLFLKDGTTPTVCVTGTHVVGASPSYFLGNGLLPYLWFQCRKCSCLTGDPADPASVCPAGGAHVETIGDETHWGVDSRVAPGPDVPGRQWCRKCGMLVPAGAGPGGGGLCPAHGPDGTNAWHDITGSATVAVPSLDMDGTQLAQGEPGGPWQVLTASDPRYSLLQRQRADGSTRVVEVAGQSTADGAAVDQYQQTGTDSQLWRLTPVPEIDPAAYYTVTARHSGKVLEVQGGPTAVANG